MCKCKCTLCEESKNALETDTFTCGNDQTTNKISTNKINHKFDYKEQCLVYLITCNKYLRQHVRQQ